MINQVTATFIILAIQVFNFLILARVIISWVTPHPDANRLTRLIYDLTEPLLAPVRAVLPKGGMIDWAPLVTFLLLQGLLWLVPRLLLG